MGVSGDDTGPRERKSGMSPHKGQPPEECAINPTPELEGYLQINTW
jgi:hypothetical protein